MALLVAEVGHVDAGGGVVGDHPQDRAGGEGCEPLPGFQDRQRAEEPARVSALGMPTHSCRRALTSMSERPT